MLEEGHKNSQRVPFQCKFKEITKGKNALNII